MRFPLHFTPDGCHRIEVVHFNSFVNEVVDGLSQTKFKFYLKLEHSLVPNTKVKIATRCHKIPKIVFMAM